MAAQLLCWTDGCDLCYHRLLEERRGPSGTSPGKEYAVYQPAMDDEKFFQKILQLVMRHMGLDCRHYKLAYLKRRLGIRMRLTGRPTYQEYAQLLEIDPAEYDLLLDRLTINVSHFFRDATVFKQLQAIILPELKRGPITIWSAGCANGEEPYSLAMLMEEGIGDRCSWRILATDIDPACLARAQTGVYKSQALSEIPLGLKVRYFSGGEDRWQVHPNLKRRVKFELNDLTGQPPAGPFDMIVCRNVLIYFVTELQDRLYRSFYKILKPGGFLVLGKTETLMGETRDLYHVVDLRERIYQKKGLAGGGDVFGKDTGSH